LAILYFHYYYWLIVVVAIVVAFIVVVSYVFPLAGTYFMAMIYSVVQGCCLVQPTGASATNNNSSRTIAQFRE